MPNRLSSEQSPYLRQHAGNPVDWYPWGDEAFAKARREDKPILVSIGYSTCHWCHVMERESFEDEAIARLMNDSFVCVKVDREERPDVDKIYMTAVQAMTGQGGWPLNAFLTPDLKPFYGGTYFPPASRYGQPGFPDLLRRIAELWKTRRGDIEADAGKLSDLIKGHLAARTPRAPVKPGVFDEAFRAFSEAFDPERAGFGGAPKFPMPVNLNFLLRYHARSGKKEALEMVAATLRAASSGGIFDHVGGGFHRYSVDAEWRVPHFEKMLYDNAQLAGILVEAWQVSGDDVLARAARRTLDYLLRDMAHEGGAFFSAEDADSVPPEGGKKAEGAFYLWERHEVDSALGGDAELFCFRYGVDDDGNAPFDPQQEFSGKNILYEAHSLEKTASKFGVPVDAVSSRLDRCLEKLRARRENRARPGLDDKILACWNGLALTAFAKAAQAFSEPKYLDSARRAAAFLEKNLYDARENRLWRRWRDGERAVAGTADDYAFLAQGLLDLYEASFEPRWLAWSLRLTERLLKDFETEDGGFYLTGAEAGRELIARAIEDSDNVEPSASSVATLDLLRLSLITGRDDLRKAAEFSLERFGGVLEDRPLALPQLLVAADFALGKPREIVISGSGEKAEALARAVRSRFAPLKVLLGWNSVSKGELAKLAPWLEEMPSDKPEARVCVARACRLPVDTPDELAKAL